MSAARPVIVDLDRSYDLRVLGALPSTLAMFAASDLDIVCEDNQLVIRGKQSEEQGRDFLHRGIAARQFQRSFLLADGMKVESAELRDGLLTITAVRPQIQKIARRIRIHTADDAAGQ